MYIKIKSVLCNNLKLIFKDFLIGNFFYININLIIIGVFFTYSEKTNKYI